MADPLSQGRASSFQPGAAKDFLLPAQRQVIGKLGHHDVGQQACGRDTFFDNLCLHRLLDQYFALTAGPFTTYVLLYGKHARRVIQLLADVFADALKLAATGALGAFWFVTNHRAWKRRRQSRTLGGLPWFGLWRSGEELF